VRQIKEADQIQQAGQASEVASLPVTPVALECNNLSKRYGKTQALDGVDLTVPRGQVLALLGPSGCGKTTALRLIAGFDNSDSGTITISGQRVFQPGRSVPPEKRKVGMVFQEGALFPHLTVEQNVAYGLPRRVDRKERVHEVLSLVGLESLRHRMPHELSGGQQQRVALGRALAPQPEILLLDEPFSNLDPGLRDQVRRDVREILRASSATAIFVTHDQEEALFVGDAVAVMRQGGIEQVDSPENIFHQPATRFVAEFIGMVDFLPAWRDRERLATEVGSVAWPDVRLSESELEVMVRPDCLDCYPSDQGQGIICSREFRGAFYLYRVSLSSGRTVRCLLPHPQEYPIGARVIIELRHGHSLRPFSNGRAIGA
jgi:iron(III) transport system ATP-binding protein